MTRVITRQVKEDKHGIPGYLGCPEREILERKDIREEQKAAILRD